jgi:hypothetical protein
MKEVFQMTDENKKYEIQQTCTVVFILVCDMKLKL